ncbi:MAG TPA: NHL repeat-containing protein [Solirubrobacterales bacterium]
MKDFTKLPGKLRDSHWLPRTPAMTLVLVLTTMALATPAAQAALGYEPDASTPSIPLAGELPHGVAIDQANQRIYVAIMSSNLLGGAPGQIDQLESTGAPTAASPFVFGAEGFPTGVAVNPLTQGIYAAQFIAATPFGSKGSSKILQFSSAGTLGTQFATSNNPGKAPQIATDSSGNVYFPSDAVDAVQVFNSAGALQSTINCSGCPGGTFTSPASVAVDSEGSVYVADMGTDRVVKFTHSGASYSFASVLQSGRGAAAVGVDPSDDSVFVGDLSGGEYHIVAYDSAGAQFDDFGSGLIPAPNQGAAVAGQIAVNATTHKLYVSEPNDNKLLVFARVTINPPTASTNPASSVGQVSAKLNATVNANRHAATDCHFEYVNATDFGASGYANATDAPCSSLPSGSESILVNATATGLSPNTTYHHRVVVTNNGGTVQGGDTIFTTLPSTPSTVTTEAATAVTQTGASLAGKVNPHGGSVSNCHFEYGIGLSYATSVPCPSPVGVVTTDVTQKKAVTGLSVNTTYHYRLVVTSNAGLVNGNDREFTTLPLAPTVTTGAASGITQTAATLAGAIDPHGSAASCRFEYGTTATYGSTVACPTDPGASEGAVSEQLNLTGLAAGTTYHYRLAGTNGGGTTNGLDLSFTTQAPPVTPLPPITQPEPPPVVPPVATPPKPLKCKKGFHKKKVHGKVKCVKLKKRRKGGRR